MLDRAQEFPAAQHSETSQRLYEDAQPSATSSRQRPGGEETSVIYFTEGHSSVELVSGSKAAIVTNNDSGSVTELNSQGRVDLVVGHGLVDFDPATGKVKDVFTTDGTTVQFDPKSGKPDEIIREGKTGALSYFKYDAATGKSTPDPQHKP